MRAAIVLLLASASAATPAAAADPMRLFEQVCVRGGGRLERGEVTAIKRDALPRAVRRALPAARQETIYRVEGFAPGYLVLQGEPQAGARGCMLIQEGGNLPGAVAAMTGAAPTRAERDSLVQTYTFRRAFPDYTIAAEILPPDFLVATVRQRAPAAAH